MPGIWNINNGYNTNSRKVSSKLTFEVGEKFTGRIVSKGDDKDVTIKLSDGWQFIAEVDGRVNFEELKLVKFQVEGSENGKLHLKIINDESKNNSEVDENFQDIIEKEGLSKEDISILKKMVAHNIPLTKKNISDIKALLQFNEKVNIDKDEINSFIEKYISSKNIELNSDKAQNIKEILTKFFEEFKNMSQDDIMLFIENNIEFNEENIESYNKLFKGDSSIEKVLDNIKNELKDMNLEEILENNKSNELPKLNHENDSAIPKREIQGSSRATKLYAENDPSNKKIDVLDILKTLANTNEEEGNVNNTSDKSLKGLKNELVSKLKNEDVLNFVKETIKDTVSLKEQTSYQASKLIEARDKSNLENVLSKIQNEIVSLSDDEFKTIVEYVKEKTVEEHAPSKNEFMELKSKSIFEAIENSKIDAKSPIKAQIKSQIDKAANIVKALANQTDLNDNIKDKIVNVVKQNMNDFKVFNSISNEYYYMNFNIAAQNLDYPCKLIIKDNRKDGKKIDSTNVKMVVSVKTANLGEIDSYLTLRDKRIDVNLKCSDDFEITIKKHKNELISGLQTLGLLVNVTVSSKEKPVDISSCRNFFNDVTISSIDALI